MMKLTIDHVVETWTVNLFVSLLICDLLYSFYLFEVLSYIELIE